jgi:hypothetical protein
MDDHAVGESKRIAIGGITDSTKHKFIVGLVTNKYPVRTFTDKKSMVISKTTHFYKLCRCCETSIWIHN